MLNFLLTDFHCKFCLFCIRNKTVQWERGQWDGRQGFHPPILIGPLSGARRPITSQEEKGTQCTVPVLYSWEYCMPNNAQQCPTMPRLAMGRTVREKNLRCLLNRNENTRIIRQTDRQADWQTDRQTDMALIRSENRDKSSPFFAGIL